MAYLNSKYTKLTFVKQTCIYFNTNYIQYSTPT